MTTQPGSKAHDIDSLQWGSLQDWFQLVRLPTAFTLVSNCLAAAIVVGSGWWPATAMLPIVIASLFAYWAGMILNDVVDLEEDREYRPNRPLPAGRISPVVAGHVATGMLLIGPIIILAVCTFHGASQTSLSFYAFLIAALLSVAVRLYNSALKPTPLGPVLMGCCRGLNILMVGLTILAVNVIVEDVDASDATAAEVALVEIPKQLLALAAGVALYILGVTIYASREEKQSLAPVLVTGILFEVAGMAVLGCLPYWALDGHVWPTLDPMRGYPLLICLIGLTVVNRGFSGVWHPVTRKVQLAVKHAILTLILLDASIVLLWAGVWYAMFVLFLLMPALLSALNVRST